VAFDPLKFFREVRAEMTKVTWPSRKETVVTTSLVMGLAAIAALFFFVADQVIGIAVRALFGLGTVSFLAGIFGFARIRRDRPAAAVSAPAIEQINEAGHEAGATS